MTGALLALPVAVPLLCAGLLLAVPYRPIWHRSVVLAVTTGVLALAVALLLQTRDGTVVVQRIGGWPAEVAISLVADTFAALMLTVTAVVVLACVAFAAGSGADRVPQIAPLILVLTAGAYGAFLAADLFNLFVMVEVMLVPSYALLSLGGGARRVSASRVYVPVNLLASTILLTGVGLLYGVTGEVRLAALAGAARDSAAAALAGGVILLALAVKAAVVPLHGWLPRSYPSAPPAVVALFSGVLTKVGVYALIRIFAVLFDGAPQLRWVIALAALVSMVVGVLAAVGEGSMRAVLSFHLVSQIGYVLLGLALFSVASLAAAIFYLVQYILVKTALFLCAGAVSAGYGTDRLDRLGGLSRREPLLVAAFGGAALSLAGMPPFSGFAAKFLIMRAAAMEHAYVSLAVALVVSLLTLVSMLKIWDAVFWRPEPDGEREQGRPARESRGVQQVAGVGLATSLRPALIVPALMLTGLTLLLGLAAAPLLVLAETAASGLVDSSGYVRAVTGR